MRACVIHSYDEGPKVEDVTVLDPEPGEILVRIAASGVCGSDMHVIHGRSVVATLPMVAVAAIHICLMLIKARNEEIYLHGVHGDVYARYCARTGRFLPRLTGGVATSASLRTLCRSVMIEQALGLAVLAVVAVLGTWPPAIDDMKM